MPSVERLKNRLQGAPVKIVMVNDGESPETVRSFIAGNRYTFRVALDTDGSIDRKYHVFGHPMSFVIDKRGDFVFSELGFREWDSPEMVKALEQLANEP